MNRFSFTIKRVIPPANQAEFPSYLTTQSAKRYAIGLVLPLILLGAFMLFYHLGTAALFEPDEGRNAEKARQMLLLNDWATPHINFVPALDKPVLFYQLIAISYKLFGVSEASARLPSALAALGSLLLICFFVKRFIGFWQALWTGLILVTCLEFVLLSRIVILDMTLNFCITLSLCSFYWGVHMDGERRRASYLMMYAAAAIATAIKGPIGFLLPGMVICSYIVFSRKWALLAQMQLRLGSGIFLFIVALWYGLGELRNPGYLRYFLWEENFLRYFTPHFKRSGPWYYFLGVLLVGFIPWTLMIPVAILDIKKQFHDDTTLFLLLWASLPILFFSVSNSKLPHYILPIYPPLAALTAVSLVKLLTETKRIRKWLLALPWLTVAVLMIFLNLIFYWPGLVPAPGPGSSDQTFKMISTGFVSLALFIFLFAAWASLKAWWPRWAFPVSCLALMLYVLLTEQTMEAVSLVRSSKAFGERAALSIAPGTQIVVYNSYPASLPFYLSVDRPIWVISSGAQTTLAGSSYIAEKRPQPAAGYAKVFFSAAEFAEQWKSQRLVAFVKEKDFPELSLRVGTAPKQLLSFNNFVLVTNQ